MVAMLLSIRGIVVEHTQFWDEQKKGKGRTRELRIEVENV
jgi:hypothetical protein